MMLAIAIALVIPFLFLLFLRKFDLHKTAKFHHNIVTLGCGVAAYLLVAQINPAMVNAGWVTWDQVIRFTAPVIEEILKSLILLYLVSRANFNYVVDGALYGFGAGIGFAIIENVEYVNANIEIALIVALLRVFSTNLMHAAGSGLIGTALAYYRGEKVKQRGIWVVVGGYAVAIIFHAMFNKMVNAETFLVAFAIGYGVLGAVLIWYVIRRGMGSQKQWVEEKLGEEDRVTKEETRAVTGIEKMVETLLIPFKERFGDEKVSLVRELLYKQAEIGIKRKLLESTPSPAKYKELEGIIQSLAKDMEGLRKQIGMYPMMFVREVYLGQDFRVWDKIQARIAESSTGQKGGGLFDRVTDRIKEKSKEKDQA
jgi:RsiW-degrading membrane proteinase PrsW (M82 family)